MRRLLLLIGFLFTLLLLASKASDTSRNLQSTQEINVENSILSNYDIVLPQTQRIAAEFVYALTSARLCTAYLICFWELNVSNIKQTEYKRLLFIFYNNVVDTETWLLFLRNRFSSYDDPDGYHDFS